ncbi:hypothetical protein GJ496_008007, partial [Pomphorhynchus laevis]
MPNLSDGESSVYGESDDLDGDNNADESLRINLKEAGRTFNKAVTPENSNDEESEYEDSEEASVEESADESDGDYEVTPTKRSKNRRAGDYVKQFLVEEAEVDDDGDDEEEDAEEGFRDIIEKEDIERGPTARDIEQRRRLEHLLTSQQEEEIEEYYRQKYDRHSSQTAFQYEQGDEIADDISQQQLLPNIRDPNLWSIKCKIGEEKATALFLMRKFISLQTSANPLQIKSVVVKDGTKGYIYIEAYKRAHVKQAIQNIDSLKRGQYKQEMVSLREMTDVLKVVKEADDVAPDSWVRLRRGIYKDDLALVISADTIQNTITLKLIPRIDYQKKRGIFKTAEDKVPIQNKRRMTMFKRPPAKLFDIDAIRAVGGDPSVENEYITFEGNTYTRDGFLVKSFPINKVVMTGVTPSLQELEKFEVSTGNKDLDVDNVLIGRLAHSGVQAQSFAPGDVVEVKDGELAHLLGTVTCITDDRVHIITKHDDLKEPLEFAADELFKYFKEGDHVKVISGQHEGETGIVIRAQSNDQIAIVLSDLTMQEMKVLYRHIQRCADVATGVDAYGQFEWGNMVLIDPKTVGHLSRLAILKKRPNQFALSTDANNNRLTVGDTVKVIQGVNA